MLPAACVRFVPSHPADQRSQPAAGSKRLVSPTAAGMYTVLYDTQRCCLDVCLFAKGSHSALASVANNSWHLALAGRIAHAPRVVVVAAAVTLPLLCALQDPHQALWSRHQPRLGC